MKCTRSASRFSQCGAALVEYALLLALIACVCIPALSIVGVEASSELQVAGDNLGSSGRNPPPPGGGNRDDNRRGRGMNDGGGGNDLQ